MTQLADIHRIVVVRALFLGDLLVATPALRGLRMGFPAAEITFVGLPWARDLALGLGSIDRFLAFPGFPSIPETEAVPAQTEAFLNEARSYAYDLAVQLHGDGSVMNSFVRELGARHSLGFARDPDEAPLTMAEPYPGDDLHEAVKFADLMRRIAARPDTYQLEFPVELADEAALNELIEGSPGARPLIALHPGASAPSRRWPVDRFAAVADRLHQDLDAEILILGGPGEVALARGVADRMLAPAVNLAGLTSIGVLGAAIARADLFICNDSGPAHIAYAVGTPSVTMFGPGKISRWSPRDPLRHTVIAKGVDCSPCGYAECPIDHRCLEIVAVDEVVDAAARLLLRRPN